MTRQPSATMPDICDCVIEDERWAMLELGPLAERAARAALDIADIGEGDWEVAVLACDDARIATLNASFRDKPTATNVLSWPAEELAPDAPGEMPYLPDGPELGDIAIAFDTCAREAAEQGIEFSDHVTHLIIHAILHLLGFDHIDDGDAELMEGLEIKALASIGIENPY